MGNNDVEKQLSQLQQHTSQGTVSQVIQPPKYSKYISLQEQNQ